MGELEGSKLRIRTAGVADAAAVAGTLTECALFTKEIGMDNSWPVPYPLDLVVESIGRQEVYVAEFEGQIAATATLKWSDPECWGPQPPVAGYVHKLGVRREYSHRRIGRLILAWAGAEIEMKGLALVRLDCQRTNPKMIAYYEEQEFRRVREVQVEREGRMILLQLLERKVNTNRGGAGHPGTSGGRGRP